VTLAFLKLLSAHHVMLGTTCIATLVLLLVQMDMWELELSVKHVLEIA
jgi:hypothetical protein